MDVLDEQESPRGHNSRGGNGEHPGPDDSSSDAPAHGGQALDRTHANDRASNRVSGADWNTRHRGAEQSDGSSAFGAEAAEGLQLGDLLSHGVDDAPAPEVRSGRNRSVRRQDDRPTKASPVGKHIGLAHE